MKKLLIYGCALIILGTAAVKAHQNSLPREPTLVLDNSKVKVMEYVSEPGKGVCGEGNHSHPAHPTVLLTKAPVKVTTADGKVVEQRAPAGTIFWSEAETHAVVNTGSKPIKAYIIETK